jgi:mercuric ion transport protein
MLANMNSSTATKSSLVGGVLAALGATACCFGPLLLVTLGLGGAWVSSLRALEAYQPGFVLLALAFIGFAFYRLYIQPRRCAPGDVCLMPAVLMRQRVVFWLVVAIIAAMFALPLYAPFLY